MFIVRSFFMFGLSLCLSIGALSADTRNDRAAVSEFMTVTGFDVMLSTLSQNADMVPNLLDIPVSEFGSQWENMVEDVFEDELITELAFDLLQPKLTEPLMRHAAAFYGSELGTRIVATENALHAAGPSDVKTEGGQAIIAALVRAGSPRLALLQRMTASVHDADGVARALADVQFRVLMAASAVGVVTLHVDPETLRGQVEQTVPLMRQTIQKSSLSNAAYAYQAYSDQEIEDYTKALEHPDMRQIYALFNAAGYEILANRLEALAREMTKLRPSEEL